MKPRIYTDTSVLGGCEDDEFREPSRRLLEAFQRGELTLVLSELTLRELETAPEGVRTVVRLVPSAHIEALALSPEAEELAAAYIAEGAIGARMRADALHIALATAARVNVLVSWNFKHIVHFEKIAGYNAVNLLHGYRALQIFSPKEVVTP